MKLIATLLLSLSSVFAAMGPTSAAPNGELHAEPASMPVSEESSIPWNRRTVEHLYNRAGFGVRGGEISRALKRTPEQVVEDLLTGGKHSEPPFYSQGTLADLKVSKEVPRTEKRRLRAIKSRDDREQLTAYTNWWIGRMVAHDDPLRDRMALFWHGLFATSYLTVKRSYDMIEQHCLIRDNAIENYGDLLQGIVRDPAMLLYLDNEKNKKGKPNENLARELLELFSLGEGNYTEADIKEVARSLTGESRDKIGNYRFIGKDHDKGSKTVFGETGRFRAPEVVKVLLRQTACSRYIAGRILLYFEGVEPDAMRLQEYAATLKRDNYDLKPFLRKLLLDPRFYREDVIAARVSGPVDYLVGATRRLSIEIDSEFIFVAATELGQRLFSPPSVKGWDGGDAWINTGSLLARGNTMGIVLDTIDFSETFMPLRKEKDPLANRGRVSDSDSEATEREAPDDESMGEMGGGMEDESMGGAMMGEVDSEMDERDDMPKEISVLLRNLGKGYRPDVNLTYRMQRMKKTATEEGLVSEMLEELLAIQPPADTTARMLEYFKDECAADGLSVETFFDNPERSEPVLRRLAHLILSLPEAQLN
ncbi:MAG: hypothetical protein ACI9F9_000267 [Candidatus Paceibacteria bacterium]|jgi:uncharacterized protein (DUF1800 family)